MPAPAGTTYWLDRWVWDTTDPTLPHWRMPDGAFACIDLRGAGQANAGGAPEGWGFFAFADGFSGSADGVQLATSLGDSINNALWRDTIGLAETPAGGTLLDVLAIEQLAALADTGPLDGAAWNLAGTPTHKGEWNVHLAGHSKVFSRRWRDMPSPAQDRVYGLIQNNYRAIRERAIAEHRGGGRPTLHNKYLWAMAAKFGLRPERGTNDFERLIPSDLRGRGEAPVRPTTTIGDTFTNTDGADLEVDHTATGPNGGFGWVDLAGDCDIFSNQAKPGGYFQAVSDLSSDDHYSQVTAVSTAAQIRQPSRLSSGTNAYLYILTGSDSHRLFKIVSGSLTQIGSTTTSSFTLPKTMRIESDGSSHACIFDGVTQVGPETDSAITGTLRAGIGGQSDACAVDNFEAADLVAGGGGTVPIFAHHYQMMRSA